MALEIRVLGPLEIVSGTTAVVLRGDRPRALLLALLVLPGDVHSADQLIDALWDEEPPPTATTALQVHVSTLRRVLGRDVIATEQGGYRLAVEPGAVDARHFERRLSAARAGLDGGDAARAEALLQEALALWRGPAFADVAYADFIRVEADRLEGLRLDALEYLAEALLALGREEEAVPGIEALLADQPYRERSWQQLMLALYRAGRQASALDAYQKARKRLVNDLGVDPGPELRDLQRRILDQDPALDRPTIVDSSERPRIPFPATEIVGRSAELEALEQALLAGQSRLVTLTGPGGVGKTRLALEIARRLDRELAGGAWFVPLASVPEAGLVLPAVSDVIGAPPTDDLRLADAVAARLKDDCLLVLDNLEHLAGAGPTIADLLASAPQLRVLVTSRGPLHVRGEREFELRPLAPEDAEGLFLQRAADVGADLAPGGALRRLCAAVDHLPLGLEIVAARAKVMTPEQMLERLTASLDIAGARDADSRHWTLRAAIAWSHDLLGVEEQVLFRRLAIFADGCTLEAAEDVCEATADRLQALMDESLLHRRGSADDSRYVMLETIHRFASELLQGSDEAEAVAERHVAYLERLARGFVEATGDELPAWLDRWDAERAEIRAALVWATATGKAKRAVALYEAIRDFTRARGRAAEERASLEMLLGSPGLADTERLLLLHEASVVAARQGDLEGGERFANEALGLATTMNDDRRVTLAAQSLAMLAGERGDELAESRHIELMLDAAGRSADPRTEIVAIAHVALRALRREEFEDAAKRYDELVRRMADVPVMRESLAACLLNRGLAELHAGLSGDAARSLAESAWIARELGDADTLGYVLEAHAALAAALGVMPTAAYLQGAAWASLLRAGTRLEAFEAAMRSRTMAEARDALGDDAYDAEHARGAEADLDESMRVALEIGAHPPRAAVGAAKRRG